MVFYFTATGNSLYVAKHLSSVGWCHRVVGRIHRRLDRADRANHCVIVFFLLRYKRSFRGGGSLP